MRTDLNFCIISNNCWGAEVYKDYNLPYNTPFVGLFIPPACYGKLCNDLQAYLLMDLNFINHSKYELYNEARKQISYPLALLGDIEIHFLHYADEKEAQDKWSRRTARMPADSSTWRVKGCDREVEDWVNFIALWNKIPFNKIFFSTKLNPNIQNNVWIFEFFNHKEVIDGKSLYQYSKNYFDVNKWLAGKKSNVTLMQNLSYLVGLFKKRLVL